MKKYPKDISDWISNHFSDSVRFYEILKFLDVKEEERVIRCILKLSDFDYDAVNAWLNKANDDYRNVIYFAEYDNRNIRKNDYNYPLNQQNDYSYE